MEQCIGYKVPMHDVGIVDDGMLCADCDARLSIEIAEEAFRHAASTLRRYNHPLPIV